MRHLLSGVAVLLVLAGTELTNTTGWNRRAHATTGARPTEGRGTRVGDIAFFTACGKRLGCELWRTDGTPEGTRVVQDIVPGPDGSGPGFLTPVGPLLYFVAADHAHGRELWQTDGTAAGTVVHDLVPGPGSGDPRELTAAGRILYFRASDPAAGLELWKADGTASGTARVKDLVPGPASSHPNDLAPLGDRLVFTADTESSTGDARKEGLFVTDGTADGTVLLKATGHDQVQSNTSAAFDGALYFHGEDVPHGRELWKTDGTVAGTMLVTDIMPGPESTGLYRLTPLGPRLLFEAWTTTAGSEPWATDGTAAGTVMLADIQPGPGSSMHRPPYGTFFTKADGPLARIAIFSAEVAGKRQELWRTDGTREGTRRVGLTGAQTSAAQILHLTAVSTLVYLAVDDDVHGLEPWRTDGTSEGTRIVHDLNPGPGGSSPYDFAVDGDSLYFAASDGRIRALWQIQGMTVTRLADNAPTWPTPLPKGVVYVGPDERGVQRVWAIGKGRRPVALTGNVFPPTGSRD